MIRPYTLVFVYGTLKRGGALHRYMEDSVFCGRHVVSGYTLMTPFAVGYVPFMVRKIDGTVEGEVFLVPSEVLTQLDMIEGAYDRTAVITDSGMSVYAYLWPHQSMFMHEIGSVFPVDFVETNDYIGMKEQSLESKDAMPVSNASDRATRPSFLRRLLCHGAVRRICNNSTGWLARAATIIKGGENATQDKTN